MIYIKVTLLSIYSYFISLICYYICIIMFTIGMNYRLYFPRILRKIKQFIRRILGLCSSRMAL